MCKEGINQNATVEGKKYGTNIFTFEQRSHNWDNASKPTPMGQGCKPDFVSDIRYTSFKVRRSVWRV